MSFSWLDGKIWVRNYQVLDKNAQKADEVETSVVEVGPRFVLTIMKIFEGSFGGKVIYDNPDYVSPNEERRAIRAQGAATYKNRLAKEPLLRERMEASNLPKDATESIFD